MTGQEDVSKEEKLMQYLESEIVIDADRNVQHKRMSPEGCTVAAVWLIGKSVKRQEGVLSATSACIQRQEAINKDILQESKDVKRLTKWVVGLTVAVVVLTAAVVGLTIVLVAKG
jgi:hypothetical protein